MLTNRKNHYIKIKAPVGADSEADSGVGCLDIWKALPSIPTLLSCVFYALVIVAAVYVYMYIYLPINMVINEIKHVTDGAKNEVESSIHTVGGAIPGI